MAGLWEIWRSPAGERIRSFTIITTPPNELCAELHNRMPAVLKPEAWPFWLGEQPADAPQLKALLAPYPSENMICWPVSARVGKVKDNDPSLIERSLPPDAGGDEMREQVEVWCKPKRRRELERKSHSRSRPGSAW